MPGQARRIRPKGGWMSKGQAGVDNEILWKENRSCYQIECPVTHKHDPRSSGTVPNSNALKIFDEKNN